MYTEKIANLEKHFTKKNNPTFTKAKQVAGELDMLNSLFQSVYDRHLEADGYEALELKQWQDQLLVRKVWYETQFEKLYEDLKTRKLK